MRFASLKRFGEEHHLVCEGGTLTPLPSLRAFSKQTLPSNRDAEMQNQVFFINQEGTPLNMLHPARTRELQNKGKAATFRTYPYVVIAQTQIERPILKLYILKIDPGSKWTGFAIQCGDEIVFRMELKHRGDTIKSDLQKRAGFRRGRRSRNLRYRQARFNRCKPEEWLAPSLMHRLQTVETWIKRFMRWCPITCIEIEQIRFDTQKLINPEISGVEYQQGELMGYEVRQYLLEKWDRKCAYCGIENVPLEVEHIHPKSKGGSDRVSNLALACHPCNQAKGNQSVAEFLSDKSKLEKVLNQAKQPLKDVAAVNTTRFAIVRMASCLCDSVKCWTGSRTKFNRCQQGLKKSHSIDAACVGESGASIKLRTYQPLIVVCIGHGTRQSRRVNASGFPAVEKPKIQYQHVQAGDVVKFTFTKNRKNVPAGTYSARVKTPTAKGFEVLLNGFRISISTMKDAVFVHRSDGYAYEF